MDTTRVNRYVVLALSALALLYAALAGLRTVGDFDIGWQLATGRYLLEHRQVFYHDVFTYTVRGQEWIYPPFSGLFFYGLHWLGGFSALSWFCAAACAGIVALLLRGGNIAGAALAIVAVPAIARRATPRADLFSTLLFAAFFSLLWQQFRRGRAPLWLLPLLMLAWVNLHLGFAAGLAAIAGYLLLELLELPFADRRAAALARLRRAAPWLAATGAATLVNPWGPRLYAALFRQSRLLESLEGHVGDWLVVRVSWASLSGTGGLAQPRERLLVAAAGVAGARPRLGVAQAVWRGAGSGGRSHALLALHPLSRTAGDCGGHFGRWAVAIALPPPRGPGG